MGLVPHPRCENSICCGSQQQTFVAPGSSPSFPAAHPGLHHRALRFEQVQPSSFGPGDSSSSDLHKFNLYDTLIVCVAATRTQPTRVPTNLLFWRDRTDLKKSYCFGSIICIPTQYTILIRIPRNKETIHTFTGSLPTYFPSHQNQGC